jgi:hypothetical protein
MASGNSPWSLQLPNRFTSPLQSRITPAPNLMRIRLGSSNGFDPRFRSNEQATIAELNQAMQPAGADGQVVPGSSDAEALGEALGGLLKRLFGGN